MNDYEIGRDIQELRSRKERLEVSFSGGREAWMLIGGPNGVEKYLPTRRRVLMLPDK
jgi:hypothetical protein